MDKTMNIAEMSAAQLEHHIEALDESHRRRMKALRALQRARLEEEHANGQGGE